ncbi:uncharacterized protein STEHIDRAFT_36077, partial [Stereum hirsutum FP-91666 SS1]|uniref:uncharacterized protein n=1 Tax=Stereum hirsutum (strain FP-91666) TaxID=721885 RepID=UPI00044498B8
LRREFQQLELLNVITKMRFEGRLPESVKGATRTAIIQSFQLWKGVEWCPPGTHPAIRWTKADPLGLIKSESTSDWQVVENRQYVNRKKAKASSAQTIGYVAAKGTTTLTSTNDEPFNARRFRTGLNGIPQPMGMRWDASSWSCAYDSLLTIMHLLYSTHNQMWTDNIADYNEHF